MSPMMSVLGDWTQEMLYIESIWFILVRDYAEIPFGDVIIGLLHSPYQQMVLGDQKQKKTTLDWDYLWPSLRKAALF